MSAMRPALRKHNSSPSGSGLLPTSSALSPAGTPLLTPTPPQLTSSLSSSRVSVVLPDKSKYLDSPSQSGTLTPMSGGIGLPRTRSGSSGQGAIEGKYRKKVGFEAFEAGPTTLFAYTCQAKSEGYKRSRNTRVFAVAVSADEAGDEALDWLMSELVEDGDEVVAIRVIELDEGERTNAANQDEFREDAHQLLATVLDKNNEAENRRISVIVEFVAGRVTEMLMKMIALYRPDSLIVGTKGTRSRLQSWGKVLGAPGMGSVSRFAVSHSPVPVIVVRPERKVQKTLAKRQNDPKRGQYAALVGAEGLSLSRSRSRGSVGGRDDD